MGGTTVNVTGGGSLKIVVFLHDQLQDGRIWGKLPGSVRTFASTHVIEAPQTRRFAQAGYWARHVERCTRSIVSPGNIATAVAHGHAARAALDLVRDGFAESALLINPDHYALVPELTKEETRASGSPVSAEHVAMMSLATHPNRDEVSRHARNRTLSSEMIEAAATEWADLNEPLSQGARELLMRVTSDRLRATLPWERTPLRRRLRWGWGLLRNQQWADWLTGLDGIADRCAIAVCGHAYGVDFDAVVGRRVPEVEIIHLNGSFPANYCDDPAALSRSIKRMVGR